MEELHTDRINKATPPTPECIVRQVSHNLGGLCVIPSAEVTLAHVKSEGGFSNPPLSDSLRKQCIVLGCITWVKAVAWSGGSLLFA
jgi:hypothetical protein